ncbi:hypothetical protein J3456_19185 [Sulfitobacter sp. NFXS29]|uniref:hypothetical protein n=1 Tax=Sulfitobacter sp. NFXS29 TaxID=2818438 RepID=UPI0032E01097
MILRPLQSPQRLIEAASIAAYDLHEFVRKKTIAELEEFANSDAYLSLGVVCHVQTDKAGTFTGTSFHFSSAPAENLRDTFHCIVPILQGYTKAEDALTKAAEDFWFVSASKQRMRVFGRELAHLSNLDLELISRNRNSLYGGYQSKSLNDALLVEVANKERELRDSDSNHLRLLAISELESTKIYLMKERQEALSWFARLSEHDRIFLPAFDCRDSGDDARAIYTYRDHKEKVGRRRARIAVNRYFEDQNTPDSRLIGEK